MTVSKGFEESVSVKNNIEFRIAAVAAGSGLNEGVGGR
jgi:hypothetical protein